MATLKHVALFFLAAVLLRCSAHPPVRRPTSAIGSPVQRSFGATGNGTTDDTAALQLALTAAGGRTLLVAPGTYLVTSTLTVPAGTTISGYGAKFDCSRSHFNALRFTDGGGVYGLTLIGAGGGAYSDAGRAIQASGTNNAPDSPTYITGPIVRDCKLTDWGGYGLFLEYCRGAVVERNTLSRIGYAGVAGMSCSDSVADHNTISDINGTGAADWYGVFWDRHNGATEAADPRSYRCSMSFNVITGLATGQGVDSHGGVDMRAVGNTIVDCMMGVVFTSSKLGADLVLGPIRGVIANNRIAGLGTGSGIVVAGATSYGAPGAETARSVMVVGNTIENAGAADDIQEGAIRLHSTDNVTVSGNVIRRPRVNGINLVQYNSGVSITGNTIVDPLGGNETPRFLRVHGNGNVGLVSGNTFRFSNAGFGTHLTDAVYVSPGRVDTAIAVQGNVHVGMAAASTAKAVPIGRPRTGAPPR